MRCFKFVLILSLPRLILLFLAAAPFLACAQDNIDSLKKILPLDRYTVYEYNSKGLLSKEMSYDKNKKKTSYKATEYDDLSRIKTEKDYRCCWTLFTTYQNIYNPDSSIAKRVIYTNNKVSNYTVYTYQQKKMTLAESFDGHNKLTAVISVKYNSDRKTERFIYKIGNKILFYSDYEYNGNVTVATKFNSSDRKEGQTENIYDNNGNEIKRIEKDSVNKVTETLEWIYKDNKEQYFKIINDKNEITSLAIDTYDNLDRLVKTEWYEKPE
jgi:hypothetical protein